MPTNSISNLKLNAYICIVDYNLTRWADVKLLTDYAKAKYNFKSILFRANPTEGDYRLADIVINLSPKNPDFVNLALLDLRRLNVEVKAVLPFSDDGIIAGSRLAEAMGLPTDCSVLAERAFSKSAYRSAEKDFYQNHQPENFFLPRSKIVQSIRDLELFLDECEQVILKPTCEGNNRGVILLKKGDSLETYFKEVVRYLEDGLIAEEVIPFHPEYSVDGIGPLAFCTQKLNECGRYPVECGQIIPARISDSSKVSLLATSKIANGLVGQNFGPFHNEIKHDAKSQNSAVVEPNRRPAGMRIWHLAERAYGINFFKLWIDQLITREIRKSLPAPQQLVGIRMLRAPSNGTLVFPTEDLVQTRKLVDAITTAVSFNLKEKFTCFDFSWNCQFNQVVTSEPKDNSQFIAQICFATDDLNSDLKLIMNQWIQQWDRLIQDYVVTNNTFFREVNQ
jgi:hypothetical protein